ncbi:MAG: major capsid protein [Bacteroidetes bacterium]|nr:major capsid protein [Bacteroidota bacterium]
MSDTTTKVILAAYIKDAMATMFLTKQFNNVTFHNSEQVEIDIMRDDEDISIAIHDLSTGARLNTADFFTNKEYKPPIHKESAVINAFDLIKRQVGEDPFMDVDFQANAIKAGVRVGKKLSPKIMRAIELQAAQIFTTGTVTLEDKEANVIYTISFNPKATHFPTVAVSWGAAGETPLVDIQNVADVIRNDGLGNPDLLEMGEGAYENFISNEKVLERLDNRRIAGSGIVPMDRLGNGGIYRGVVEIGNYKYDIWTYGGRYNDPATGNKIKYIEDDKVIVRDSTGRLDATFGGIPKIGTPDPRVPSELRTRISSEDDMLDMQHHAWLDPSGDGLTIEVGTRPLLVPVAIDTFGCITTTAP